MKSNEIRAKFLEFFKSNGHEIVASSSLIPQSDPTLLFTNAGMNQFKNAFLGKETRPYKRATTIQRCVRAGGKHNDLEMVGYSPRHHTFFEMLGNFSFGDYFKRDAIKFAWEFLTSPKWLNLDPKKLWVTVHEKDQEAAKIWIEEIKIDPKLLSYCGDKDNFWAMGETGPCGYCSEIYHDYGPELYGDPPGLGVEGDRYIEIWNLVFMEFDRKENGELTKLPHPSIDTGMGLERITAALQPETHGDNYKIDIFKKFYEQFQKEATNILSDPSILRDKQFDIVMRITADHLRAVTAIIADGVMPSNEDRGYVLRSILRRAIYHLYKFNVYQQTKLQPFFYHFIRLGNPLIDALNDNYPEMQLTKKIIHIKEIIENEEKQFLLTLENGSKILEQEIKKLKATAKKNIAGDIAFHLHDTYGFPIILTEEMARRNGLLVDLKSFNAAMNKQRERSQATNKFKKASSLQLSPELRDLKTEFQGYDQLEISCDVVEILNSNGEPVTELNTGEQGIIVLNKTPFYAESGGQASDTGTLSANNVHVVISSVQKSNNLFLHYAEVISGKLLTKSKNLTAKVDLEHRLGLEANHSATHLLHAALRQLLGEYKVVQKGSEVTSERLRFDFSYPKALSHEEILLIEKIVNEQIRRNFSVCTRVLKLAEAKEENAIALFSEKYADIVRMVTMGNFSKELCGGTHVKQTGQIGLFKITSESGIAAGVRRIEAVTAASAIKYIQGSCIELHNVSSLLHADSGNICSKINELLQSVSEKNKQIINLQTRLAGYEVQKFIDQAIEVNGAKILTVKLQNTDISVMRNMLDNLRQKMCNCHSIFILSSVDDDSKIKLIAGVTETCKDKFHAGELIKFISSLLGGSGGGRPEMAQGGGTDPSKLDSALNAAVEWIKQRSQKALSKH
jgi:alanyl-tRNA synthetase